MKSTTGEHYVGLDHLRACAAFLVVAWHFNHRWDGYPVPFGSPPIVFPLSLVDEGHTGVALFMTLSGYLFAKLLTGKQIDLGAFFWNRALRLLPLLGLVCGLEVIQEIRHQGDVAGLLGRIAAGIVLPTLPSGGWSITTEFHFYLVLPLLLALQRRSHRLPWIIVLAALLIRSALYVARGDEIESLAYWTIVGRIDQFTLGILFFQLRHRLKDRHLFVAGVMGAFMLMYAWLDRAFGSSNFTYSSSASFWIYLPTVEGLVYAMLIAWYDTSFRFTNTGLSRAIALAGSYSYSIYLLHFFFVFRVARFVNEKIMDISNFYLATLWALLFFVMMVPLGYLSFRFVEGPFLSFRKRYASPLRSSDSPFEEGRRERLA